MSPERIQRALIEVTREARIEPAPEIDWEAMEEQLPMTRVKTLPPRARSYRPLLLAAALSFAAVALLVGWLREPAANRPRAEATAARPASRASIPTEIDGSKLTPGTRIVAGEVAQTVVHRGHATWTLAPRSTGVLLTQGEVLAIRLEIGSVTARVVKSSRVETFAVEAADVRVAAHGTEFVVTLAADGVSVKVTEGSVLVGPRDEPGVGQLLLSPSAKQFTLAGTAVEADESAGLDALRPGRPRTGAAPSTEATATKVGGAEAPSAGTATGTGSIAAVGGPKPKTTTQAAAESEPSATTTEPTGPEHPTDAALESAAADVIKLAATCFKQRTATSDGIRVTAQTTITFRTLADGGVRSVDFEPPLSPWVQACVKIGMGTIHTESTRYGFQVSRTVNLER
jgi:ferric-dicitrate binding protein FerR (iron transport regulator)